MSDETVIRGWVRHQSIPGGWLVTCRLCGKQFKRSFVASNTNYAEAESASRVYVSQHLDSDAHAAALAAFHADVAPEESKEERVLREVFKLPARSETDLRREAARRAAAKAGRK